MRIFWKTLVVVALLIATFVTAIFCSTHVIDWFDKTFVSKDSKVVGEWSVDSIKVSKRQEYFELHKDDLENFILEYDESKATTFEKIMYSVSEYQFNQFINVNEDGTLEIYKLDETGEKQFTLIYTWSFERGCITVKNEDSELFARYRNKTITIDINTEDDIVTSLILKKVEVVEEDNANNESEEFSVIGEWNVTETKLESNTDSFTLKVEDYEEFKANYDESTASELESNMYEICDGMFLQKYVITEEKFEIHMFNGEEFECVGEFDYTINEDGNLVYSFDAEDEPMVVLIQNGSLINQQGSLDDIRISQIFGKIVNA